MLFVDDGAAGENDVDYDADEDDEAVFPEPAAADVLAGTGDLLMGEDNEYDPLNADAVAPTAYLADDIDGADEDDEEADDSSHSELWDGPEEEDEDEDGEDDE
jgi:hypothetical protein